YQQVPILVSLERVEPRFGVKMAGDTRFEAADETCRQKIILRHNVSRQMSEISARKCLLLGSAGRTEQSESRVQVVRLPAQAAREPAHLHDIGREDSMKEDLRELKQRGLERMFRGDNRRKDLHAQGNVCDWTPRKRGFRRQHDQHHDAAGREDYHQEFTSLARSSPSARPSYLIR